MYDERYAALDRSVFLVDILLSSGVYALTCLVIRNLFPAAIPSIQSHLFVLPMVLFILLTSLSYFGAYRGPRDSSYLEYFWSIAKSIAASTVIIVSLFYILNVNYISREVLLAFSAAILIVLTSFRFLIKHYFEKSIKEGERSLRVLIVGTGERAQELANTLLSQAELGVDLVGFIDSSADTVGKNINGAPVIGTISDITSIFKDHVIDEVVIAMPRSLLADAEQIAVACEEEGVKLRFMADLFNVKVARVSLSMIGQIPLLTMEPVAHDEGKLFLKRIIDILLVTISLPVLLPLMAAISLAIVIDSPGPVLFVQERVGYRKHLFRLYKFRSMCVDAEERLKEIEHLNEAQGPIFKMRNDPRVTRVGRFLRKTSLDELPQLFNVLKGDMSLVGPRPMSKRDVNLFDKGVQRKRFSVKPGITCLWQISGRSELPFEDWLRLDLEYIDNWSLLLDFKILLKTIPAVLSGKGAV